MNIPQFLKTYPTLLVATALLSMWFTLIGTKPQAASAGLTIEAVPSGASIKVNGHTGKEGLNTVTAGKVHISISYKGFKTSDETITIDASKNHYYGVVLDQDTETYTDWYSKHPDDSQKSEGISSKNFDESSRNASKNAPIVGVLPFTSAGNSYRIDFGGNDSATTLYITGATPSNRQSALTWIRTGGYDISDYRTVFVNKEPE